MISALLDHIWQSSLFAGGAGLLTLAFRRNSAALRFWLWFAASLKFLVPFAALAALGEYLSRQFPAPLPQSILVLQPAAEKLSAPVKLLVAPQVEILNLAPLLLGLWLTGFAVLLAVRLLRWSRLRAMIAQARDLAVFGPVRVKASSSLLEPGLVGILRPAVLMPAGLLPLLSDAERDSILAHELSHLNRGDNFTAAIHMTVEALFWFYPPVWLIGARLIAERERACDENVLASGHDPEVYAGGILKVCKFCIQSPLACVSGVSGADLGMRVRMIMTEEAARDVGAAKQLLLAGACAFTLAIPVMAGFLDSPLALRVKRDVIAVQARAAQAVTDIAQQIDAAPQTPVTVASLPPLKVKLMPAPPVLPVVETAPAVPAAVPAAPVAVQPPPEQSVAVIAAAPLQKEMGVALDPRGDGDPDAVTCRAPQPLPGSRLPGPQVCKTNRVWAQLRAEGQDVSADGTGLATNLLRNRAPVSACGSSALLGSFQSQNLPEGSVLSACR
jgi:beta-lactamase regulating signal transducer with metallopeptidase domain